MDERTKRLIAVGASVGANCHPCLEYHTARARELGIRSAEITEVVEVAKAVRGGAMASIDRLALKLLAEGVPRPSGEGGESRCCCP